MYKYLEANNMII